MYLTRSVHGFYRQTICILHVCRCCRQVWSKFGHTIWHRGFCRVLRLHTYTSPLAFFFRQPFSPCFCPSFNFPLLYIPNVYMRCLGNQGIIISNLFRDIHVPKLHIETGPRQHFPFFHNFYLIMLSLNVLLFCNALITFWIYFINNNSFKFTVQFI